MLYLSSVMGLYFPWDFCFFPGTVCCPLPATNIQLLIIFFSITFVFSSGMSSLNSFALHFIPSMVAIAVAVTSVIVFYILKRSVKMTP